MRLSGGRQPYRLHLLRKKPPEHRCPDSGRAADRIRCRAKVVAVTVDADNETLEEIIAFLKPDILQLHGGENAERVLSVKAMFGLPVMKAFFRAHGG